MVKQDRLSIIDAIEKASEAELKELTRISTALQNLPPFLGVSQPSANDSGKPDTSSPALVVSRRLKDRQRKNTINKPLKGPKSTYEEDNERTRDNSKQEDKNKKPLIDPKGTYKRDNKSPKGENDTNQYSPASKHAEINSQRNSGFKRELKTFVDVLAAQGQSLNRNEGVKPARSQLRRAEASNDPSNVTGRDASGRFVSREKADEANKVRMQKLSQQEQEKMQAGFFSRLGKLLTGDGKGNSHADAEGAELVGGAAVGGPIWTLGKGVFDLGKSMSDNVVSLQKWMNDRKEGKEQGKPAPAKVHQPVTAQPPAPPAMGVKASVLTFRKGSADKEAEATQQQTKVIAANDERIIDKLDDINLSIKRQSNGAEQGGLLSKLMGDRFGRSGWGRGRRTGRKGVSKKVARVGVAGRLKALFTTSGALKTAGTIAAGGALTTAGAKVATEAATKAAPVATKTAAAKVAAPVAEEAGESLAKKGALKVGGKLGAKAALKMVPILGTALGVGWDALDGVNDEEGRRAAFNTGEGQEVSNRQKSAYTMANVLNMGGLVSGGAGLLASGARMFGMDKVADSLTFDTGSIAKGLDTGMAAVGDAISKVKSSYEDKGDLIATAVADGTDKTVTAINRLGTQMQGGEWGQDNVGASGQSVSDYASVDTNNISPDLNIGGKNAAVRSFRNNNFGNLNYVGQEGARLEDPNAQGEARFAKFNTPEEGFRALAQQLTLYSTGKSKATGGKKLNSVEDIIKVYAPESENNTQKYISSLSEKMGVAPGQQLNLENPEVMTQMIRGIATIEGGNPQVTDQFIKDSIGHNEAGKWVGGKFSDESLKVVNEERAKKGLAPVAQNSLYSTGTKVITQSGQTQPVTPSPVPTPAPASQADPASAVKFREEKSKAETAKSASAMPEKSGAWDAIKSTAATGVGSVMEASRELDGALQDKMTQYNVRGMAKNRPSAALTLPAGATLPSALAVAALPPSEIARRSRASSANNKPAAGATTVKPAPAPAPARGAAITPQAVTAASTPNDQPEESMFDKAMGGAMDGLKAVGASILPAVSDTLNQTISGFSGGQLVGDALDAVGLADPTLQRAISPITSKAGTWLDSGVDKLKETSTSLLTGPSSAISPLTTLQPSSLAIPSSMPVVKDLAASQVRPALSGDAANHDLDILKELRGMGATLEQMLGLSKKGDAPEKVVHTAQPAPRKAASFSIRDNALDELLRD